MDVDLFATDSRQPVTVTSVNDADMDEQLREPLARILSQGNASAAIPTATPNDRVGWTDHVVDEERGVIVRIYRAGGEGDGRPKGCLYAIHGGGYIMGDRSMEDSRMVEVCPALDIVGAAVEYRLAPGCPYPGPLEDCYDGLAWLIDNAADLGIDPQRIGIHGGSAGGGLAAALALLVRDRAEFEIQFQLLMCPMIDDRQITPSSQLDGLSVWPRQANTTGWQAYLGELYGRDDLPIYAAAARALDLSDLPPTYVAVGGIDGFRDENIDYAMRLYQAGVPTELHVYPGGPHGYGLVPDAEISQQSTRDATDWLRRQFARLAP